MVQFIMIRRPPRRRAAGNPAACRTPETFMANIHIAREHALGLREARRVALQWAEKAQVEFGMEWTHEPGTTRDLISFSRSGVNGTLAVTKDIFELDARLGFLASVFKHRIETEIVKNLDALMAETTARHENVADNAGVGKKTA